MLLNKKHILIKDLYCDAMLIQHFIDFSLDIDQKFVWKPTG